MNEKLPPTVFDSAGTASAVPTLNARPTAAPLAASRPILSLRIVSLPWARLARASEMHSLAIQPGVTRKTARREQFPLDRQRPATTQPRNGASAVAQPDG